MLRNTRKGFTLIELLIVVVIIGILAAIAIPKFANTKDKAKVSSMKTDLRNLVSAQEAHFSDYNTYATGVGTVRSNTTIVFTPTNGNTIPPMTATAAGWSATITRADLAENVTCGVFVGQASAPDPSITVEGAVGCY